jgi:transcriptional regulator with XRE-family HTH domain
MDHLTPPDSSTSGEPVVDDGPVTGSDNALPTPDTQPADTAPGRPADDVAGPTSPAFSKSRLRAWRHLRSTDYATLARAAGISSEDVAAYEAGNHGQGQPTTWMITAWAAALGCQPDQLRSNTPDGPDEYWQAANQAMGPMSREDLAVVADVILRSRRRRQSSQAGDDSTGCT